MTGRARFTEKLRVVVASKCDFREVTSSSHQKLLVN